jgi:protein TonB
MFESVAPETFVPRSRKLFYESLPASIAAHVAAAALVIVGGSWNVAFPDNSPRMTMMYTLALPPTPPPAAPSRPAAKPAPKAELPEKKVQKPETIVAPTVIPDEIPTVEPPQAVPVEHTFGEFSESSNDGVIGGVGEGSGFGGGGELSGSGKGSEGGLPGGIEGGIPTDTVVIQRNAPLPMSMTPMAMVYPFYPEEARMRGWEDAVTVRYVIGKDGRVKTVTVLESPQREIFEKTVVKAIRHWRFRPLIKAGVAQEVIHELVIYFKLNESVG